MTPTKPFWMIYGIGQRQPTYKHECLENAQQEARRLARNHPNISFVILEAVEAVTKREFDVVTYRKQRDGADQYIPF